LRSYVQLKKPSQVNGESRAAGWIGEVTLEESQRLYASGTALLLGERYALKILEKQNFSAIVPNSRPVHVLDAKENTMTTTFGYRPDGTPITTEVLKVDPNALEREGVTLSTEGRTVVDTVREALKERGGTAHLTLQNIIAADKGLV